MKEYMKQNAGKRRTAEINVKPYKVIDWELHNEDKRFAVVDLELVKALAKFDKEEQGVIVFGRTRAELEHIAHNLNTRYEGALKTKVVTDEDAERAKRTFELTPQAMKSVDCVYHLMKEAGAMEAVDDIAVKLASLFGIPKNKVLTSEHNKKQAIVNSAITTIEEMLQKELQEKMMEASKPEGGLH